MNKFVIGISILVLVLILAFVSVIYFRGTRPYYLKLKPTTLMEDVPRINIPFISFTKSQYSFPQFIYSLSKYAKDKKLKGIYINLSDFKFNWEQAYEFREVLKRFKDKGKKIICYAHAYTEKSYFVAGVCDEIYMGNGGVISLTGFAGELWYFRGLLDKLKIVPQFIQFEEYKSAVEPLTRKEPSEYDKEQRERIYEVFFEQLINALKERGIENPEEVINEKGIITSDEALSLKLVDKLMYESELEDYLKEKFKSKPRKFKLKKDRGFSRKRIVVISAEGPIVSKDTYDPVNKSLTIGFGLAEDLKKLRKDKNVSAVILRVNSPGGSSLTSDAIAHELKKLSEEKLVIVSMGFVAASGGYYISAYADKIFATPYTITGSIGVLLGKLALEDFLRDILNINPYIMQKGYFADIGTSKKIDEDKLQRLKYIAGKVYDDFLNVVSEGRRMDVDSVRRIAKGRVWIGEDARNIGIVDSLGGVLSAIEYAKKRFPNANVVFYKRKYDVNLDLLGIGALFKENVMLIDPILFMMFISR